MPIGDMPNPKGYDYFFKDRMFGIIGCWQTAEITKNTVRVIIKRDYPPWEFPQTLSKEPTGILAFQKDKQ